MFMAAPDADPSDAAGLSHLALALARRRAVLLCVNGPGAGGAVGRWRGAIEALCAREVRTFRVCVISKAMRIMCFCV